MTLEMMQVVAQATPNGPADQWQWWGTLGVGGILAGLMFFFNRRDADRHEKTIIEMKEQHEKTIVDMSERHESTLLEIKRAADRDRAELSAVIKENTTAIAHNTSVSQAMVAAVNRIVPEAARSHWKSGRG